MKYKQISTKRVLPRYCLFSEDYIPHMMADALAAELIKDNDVKIVKEEDEHNETYRAEIMLAIPDELEEKKMELREPDLNVNEIVAEAAKELYDAFQQKYGIDIDDVLDDEDRKRIVKFLRDILRPILKACGVEIAKELKKLEQQREVLAEYFASDSQGKR